MKYIIIPILFILLISGGIFYRVSQYKRNKAARLEQSELEYQRWQEKHIYQEEKRNDSLTYSMQKEPHKMVLAKIPPLDTVYISTQDTLRKDTLSINRKE